MELLKDGQEVEIIKEDMWTKYDSIKIGDIGKIVGNPINNWCTVIFKNGKSQIMCNGVHFKPLNNR